MPGPFPGMDPYLESPTLWLSVHQALAVYLAEMLNVILPPQYVARSSERVYLVQPDRSIYPDAAVVERYSETRSIAPQRTEGGTAVIDRPIMLSLEPVEVREGFVEIILPSQENRLVTAIEILSPANKASGSEGRELYLKKQDEVLQSPAHLLEIDLLRQGEHTAAVSQLRLRAAVEAAWDYLVCLHRANQKTHLEAWPIILRNPLPSVAIPLAEGDADIPLDLQALLNRVYDSGAYARQIDYQNEAPFPLQGSDAEWADGLLRRQGLR